VERQLSWNRPEGLCLEVYDDGDDEVCHTGKLKENMDISSARKRGNIKT
jgi:hypothetical protein